jgi:hypothetical protein
MKNIVALLLVLVFITGCIEQKPTENEEYFADTSIFKAPDTRIIDKKLENVTYNFGNEKMIAQIAGNMSILNLCDATDPLLDHTRVQLKFDKEYISPTTLLARSNMVGFQCRNPNFIALTFCDNSSGLVQKFTPQKRMGMNLTLSLYGQDGFKVLENGAIRLGNLVLSSNLNCIDCMVVADGLEMHYEFDRPLYLGFSNDVIEDFDAIYENAISRADWIDERFLINDSIYETMFSACLDCAISSFKCSNGTRSLFAGTEHNYTPSRTYFRDGYWTSQILLPWSIDKVKNQILTLARGVHSSGQCPGGVLLVVDGTDWQSDYYDSPSYFVMLVYDYIAWSGDFSILDYWINNSTIWEKMLKCMEYLNSTDTNGNYLPEKPWRCERDWTDQVYRDPEVTYNSVLYYRALVCVSEIAKEIGEESITEEMSERAEKVKQSINENFWDEKLGYYIDYEREIPENREDHLNGDTFIALLYGVADESQRDTYLEEASKLLHTENNGRQPYGDWGVMCCYPLYSSYLLGLNGRGGDTFEVSALPYHYHNGSDWPCLDGVNAMTRLWFGDEDYEYPLTRWWRYSMEKRWLTPVEWYCPEPQPYTTWGFKHGGSSFPGAAILFGGYGFYPKVNGTIGLAMPLWEEGEIRFTYRNESYSVINNESSSVLFKDGKRLFAIGNGSRVQIKMENDGSNGNTAYLWNVRDDCDFWVYGDIREIMENGKEIPYHNMGTLSMLKLRKGREYKITFSL